MKNKFLILQIIILVIIALFILFSRKNHSNNNIPDIQQNNQAEVADDKSQDLNLPDNKIISDFIPPLEKAGERVTKKPFGIFIDPETSLIQPEKFKGYHTGTDFEIFPEELNSEVPARAVCSGKLLVKEYASGYGGVAVQSCELDKNPITVIYGHLELASIMANIGENINAGEAIGILGADQSVETSGERKHLHLGFYKVSSVNIRGYVSSQADLSGWIDPCLYVCL